MCTDRERKAGDISFDKREYFLKLKIDIRGTFRNKSQPHKMVGTHFSQMTTSVREALLWASSMLRYMTVLHYVCIASFHQ